jgi:CheY-like chemotaxis protein
MDYTWSNFTTLIAEDDPLNYKYMELLLARRTGINIIWAKDGLEATQFIRNNSKIDIVLLDLQLPEIDGLKTLNIIKMDNPFIPVIIQTANSWNNEEELCCEAGSDGFFNKPLNMDRLLARMDECLKIYSHVRHSHLNV